MSAASSAARSNANRQALLYTIILTVVLWFTVGVALLMARVMVGPLRTLTRTANEVADQRLPGLVDRLQQSTPARVVTVASNAHAQGRIDFDDLQGERSYSGARAYSQSKLANVLFTYELARRLPATSVTANALHPGVVRTSFGAEDPGGLQRRFTPLLRPFMKAPAQGAATSIHVASAPDLEQVTGRYFASSKPKRSSKGSYDEAAAARLWQVSADLVGLAE